MDLNIKDVVKTVVPALSTAASSGNNEEKTGLERLMPIALSTLPLFMKDKEDDKDKTTSDERLKNIFGDNEDAIKCFAKIDAIKFTYNDKAKELDPTGEKGVDDEVHYGVKAQDLEANPLTKSAVVEDEQGNKMVDTKELTAANSAVISEICKRIEIIENILGIKVV